MSRAVVQEIGQLAASLAKDAGVVTILRRKASIQVSPNPAGMMPIGGGERRQIKREVRAQNVPVNSSITVTVKRV